MNTHKIVPTDYTNPSARPACASLCGRTVAQAGDTCAPCRRAQSEGYHLSPAPRRGERNQADRERRLALYAERAARREPLFGDACHVAVADQPV